MTYNVFNFVKQGKMIVKIFPTSWTNELNVYLKELIPDLTIVSTIIYESFKLDTRRVCVEGRGMFENGER
ncbi:hypothetical protein MKW98_020386 [Papaver atlanticum]|uniref:Uncharacterized protein n=1 Tax=Papaver atlanticum TaxID=357466 RepID=A0AAD4RW08_9MAGN|nr:hypothetical protein MKW98_020386 [Papaver atlanticum]